jgi:hypothetical protein
MLLGNLVSGMEYVKNEPDNRWGHRFGPGSEFGSEKLLRFFDLLPPNRKTDPKEVRHTLGFGHPALTCQKNPLPFLHLLPGLDPLPAPHNRQVEGSSPSGPTIFYINHRLITTYTIRLFRGDG